MGRSVGSRRCLAAVAMWAFLAGASARADLIYGVSDESVSLLTIDPVSGRVLGSKAITGTGGGHEDLVPVADDPGHLLLSAYGGGAIGSHTLFRVDPATGVATMVGDITDGAGLEYWVEGMAYVNGVLYGSASRIDITGGSPHYLGYAPDTSDTLIRIDPTTGHATRVGSFGPDFLNVEDLAWSPRFGLIGSDIGTLDAGADFATFHTTPALIRIDPATGRAVKIADMPHGDAVSNPFNSVLSPSGPFVAGLEFSPDGATLFGATIQTHFGGAESGVVTISPTTGALTSLGAIDQPVLDGITFPTLSLSAVPEPSTLAACGLIAIALAGYRLRRRAKVA